MSKPELPTFLQPGSKNELGSFTFKTDEIIDFATKYDPQPFHTDIEAAKNSLFGSLCASGWHTISVWMKMQRKFTTAQFELIEAQGGNAPIIGPSPGIKQIKWPRPVFAGETVTYFTNIEGMRQSKSRPEWHLMSQFCEGYNQNDDLVLSFSSTVFLQLQ